MVRAGRADEGADFPDGGLAGVGSVESRHGPNAAGNAAPGRRQDRSGSNWTPRRGSSPPDGGCENFRRVPRPHTPSEAEHGGSATTNRTRSHRATSPRSVTGRRAGATTNPSHPGLPSDADLVCFHTNTTQRGAGWTRAELLYYRFLDRPYHLGRLAVVDCSPGQSIDFHVGQNAPTASSTSIHIRCCESVPAVSASEVSTFLRMARHLMSLTGCPSHSSTVLQPLPLTDGQRISRYGQGPSARRFPP
jgi:hypothetical protein